MEEHAWLNPVAIVWAIVIIVLASFGIYWLAKQRRGLGWSMLAASVLLVVIPVGSITWWESWGSKEHSMSVQGLSATSDPLFTVNINHDSYSTSTTNYTFGGAGDTEHVVDVFQDQHPDGVPTIPTTLSSDAGISVWHLTMDDVRFDLYAGQDANFFELVSGVGSVVDPGNGDIVATVPYPAQAGGSQVPLGVATYRGLTWDQWLDFYEGMAEVTVGDGTITLPTDIGGTLTLTFDEARETYIATVDD